VRIPQTYRVSLALAGISLIGATVLMLSTQWGAGLSPDSVTYIGAARSLLAGHGLSVPTYSGGFSPLTQFPPLFSALLSVVGSTGIDPLEGARWLNAIFFAANIALVGLIVYSSTGSIFLSLLGSVLMVVSFPMAQAHSMAWSEPVFIFFGFLGLFLLALYMGTARFWILAASSFAIALCLLARYAGAAFIAAGVLGLLLLSQNTGKKKWWDAVVFFLISSAPMLGWVIRNTIVAGTAAGREIAFHPITSQHLKAATDTFSTWLLPPSVPSPLRWLGLIIVAIILMSIFHWIRRQKKQSEPWRITGLSPLLGVFILCYAMLLLVSISLLDAHTPLDNRILSPVYVAIVVLGLSLSRYAGNLSRPRAATTFLIIVCVFFSFSQITQTVSWLSLSYRSGIGYANRRWKESGLIKHIGGLDPARAVFTNASDVIYIHTGRSASMIPAKINPGTRQLNGNYPTELIRMGDKLRNSNGVVCYFSGIRWRWYLAPEDELRDKLSLRLLVREKDGSIYSMQDGKAF